jgi:prolyl-tRNA synthetase
MNAQKQQNQQAKKIKTAVSPTREENFPEWYQAVIKAADMAENSPTRGCMTIKPYGFALWDNVKNALDAQIQKVGVQNCYFPLLIPMSFLTKEADHIDGFATECAVVTHHRLAKNEEGVLTTDPTSELSEPYIIRPTSETIIGESVKNWIQSYRDLPMKLNQWCNVFRWEMRTRLFLRTAEFLWQEGHNVFETEIEARKDAELMLDVYADVFENWMAMPVIKGWKTEDERFPGAIDTLTVEAMMQDGKALQSATSHHLGQTFSKSADITFQSRDGDVKHAWTTSWGFSTRSIGGLIMSHSDDDGLMVPPKIAQYQAVIIPFMKDDTAESLTSYCETLTQRLNDNDVRVKFDDRDLRAGDKGWEWIKKGVPLRVEIGGREMEEGNVTVTRRDLGKSSKTTMTMDEFVTQAQTILDEVQNNMFNVAKERMESRIIDVDNLDDARAFFADDRQGFVRLDKSFWGTEEFDKICSDFAVTPRCIPLDTPDKVIIGKSY